ncbi:MAG: Coenzyme F420 hydrogenase/dehydrogenase, beta subunit C-terminal domain [Oscillospiraceae bacterium]
MDYPIGYYGYYNNESMLLQSASGGALTAISTSIIEKGGVVYGVGFTKDFKGAEYYRITSVDDLKSIKGSKYIVSNKMVCNADGTKNNVFDLVSSDLKEKKTVLFSGLGCDVGALKKILTKKNDPTDNLYTVDLICHGSTYSDIQKQFVEYLEDKYSSKVTAMTLRGKKNGWQPYIVSVCFANGRKYSKPFYKTDYGYAFNFYCRTMCYKCQYKGPEHQSELTVGDFYGLNPGMEQYNKFGTSLIICNNEKGRKLLETMDTDGFVLGETDIDSALKKNVNYYKIRERNKYWEHFDQDFKKNGLHEASNRLHRLKWTIGKSKIYRTVRRFL